MTRRWRARVVASTALVVVVALALQVAGFEPDPLRVLLLGAVCVSAAWVVIDVLVDPGPGWGVVVEPAVAEPGADTRLSTYRRMLDSHLQGAAPDPAVRDALARLARAVLARRHDLTWDDPAARERLHPDLLAVLDAAPRRLDGAEIDRCLHHIEEI
ncbi:hypothetical protein JOE61_002013 [Nocardioides salarius]|uniref:Uncharacterized protein n=1 Tax=Nocardioides salarius TaxID=374513 RepID=A0ABS2MAK3_9ACTN|nr:hypothetical protein [Nocardioides salarius]MBM7508199.1 hypothetical protein [Nocardioides salarius]